jgi:hypothetical protein
MLFLSRLPLVLSESAVSSNHPWSAFSVFFPVSTMFPATAFLIYHSNFTQPFGYIISAQFFTSLPRTARPSRMVGLRAKLSDIRNGSPQTASFVRAKRYNGSSGKIVSRQKSYNMHGYRTPPIRIANENHIVRFHVLNFCFQCRSVTFFKFLLCLFHNLIGTCSMR